MARCTADIAKREKEYTRLGDELARERRELPWVRVEKDYRFQTDDGERSLAELFDGRSQLLVYHFMFGPSYQAGCPVNSSPIWRPIPMSARTPPGRRARTSIAGAGAPGQAVAAWRSSQ
jgi:hypothetical protein